MLQEETLLKDYRDVMNTPLYRTHLTPNCWGRAGTEDRVFFLRNKSKRLDNKKLII